MYCSIIIAQTDSALRIFGIRLAGLSQDSGKKRLLTVIAFAAFGELRDYLIAGHSEILLPKTQRPWAGWTPTG